MTWLIEPIPNEDFAFMRAHRSHFTANGRLRPGVFRDQGAGMSCDWSKYATVEQTQARAKVPNDNGVLVLNVGSVRGIDGLLVEHRPIPELQAHSEIVGKKTEEIRLKLLRLAELRLRVPAGG